MDITVNTDRDKTLLRFYLENDDLNSLCEAVVTIHGDELRRIIASMLNTHRPDIIEECLIDYFDYLITPTEEGEKRLRNFDFTGSFGPYIRSALRTFIYDRFRKEQTRRSHEISEEEAGQIGEPEDVDPSDMAAVYESLFSALGECEKISERDRYILLTYLLYRITDGEETDDEIHLRLSHQLGMTPAAVKKARQRAVDQLKRTLKINI